MVRGEVMSGLKIMEPNTVGRVPVAGLRLDRKNPRLIERDEDAPDETIIARLYSRADLDELLQAISANGYLDIEPLVAMPEGDKMTVLEGNRRLAALLLLREPDLVMRNPVLKGLGVQISGMEESRRPTLEEVSVFCVKRRDDARSFIGFKHINGPAKWDAYAKARFVAEWYRQCGNLEEIARTIGDRHDTVRRMVSAIYVLDQARDNNLFSIEDRYAPRFAFSHLYTALGRFQYMAYLGIETNRAGYEPKQNPVIADKLGELRQLLCWLYGSKSDDARPIIQSQNPDIKRLGEVLANAEGLNVLKVKADLDAAYEATGSVDRRFVASLLRARDAIRDTAVSLRAYDGHDTSLLGIAEDVHATAESVCLSMRKKSREALAAE